MQKKYVFRDESLLREVVLFMESVTDPLPLSLEYREFKACITGFTVTGFMFCSKQMYECVNLSANTSSGECQRFCKTNIVHGSDDKAQRLDLTLIFHVHKLRVC